MSPLRRRLLAGLTAAAVVLVGGVVLVGWSNPPTGSGVCDVQTRITTGQIVNNEVDFPWAYVNLDLVVSAGTVSPSTVNVAPSAPKIISITGIPAGVDSVTVTGTGAYYAAFGTTPLEATELVPFTVTVTGCAATTTSEVVTVPSTDPSTVPVTDPSTVPTTVTTTPPGDPTTTTRPAPGTTAPSPPAPVPPVPESSNGTESVPPAPLTDSAPARPSDPWVPCGPIPGTNTCDTSASFSETG